MTSVNAKGTTPLPSIHWHHTDNDGCPLPVDERCWWLTFDVGSHYLDVQLFADGRCEWFAVARSDEGAPAPPLEPVYSGNEEPESFDKVAHDPAFTAAMEAIKGGYDALMKRNNKGENQ